MKPISAQQIRGFLQMVGDTRDHEFDCTEFHTHMAELIETQLAGHTLDDILASAEHHLTQCPECTEEFEALKKVLAANALH